MAKDERGRAFTADPAAALAKATLLAWGLGTLCSEGLQQASLGAALLLGAWLAARKRLFLVPQARSVAWVGVALCAWQLLSPLVALASGAAAHWPRWSRYGQAPEALAVGAVAAVAALGVPWRALGWLLGAGWLAQGATALFQYWVPWPFGSLGPLKLPLARLQENFGPEEGPIRHAGLGLFFHRLRLAHGAVAMLGPALACASDVESRARRAAGLFVALTLLVCTYLSYARAALGAAAGVLALAVLVLLRGRSRALVLACVALAAVGVALSPGWRQRIARTQGYLDPERKIALSTGFAIARAHPIVGVGFGNYKPAAIPIQGSDETAVLLANDAHDFWLTVWAETGLVGVALMLAFHALLARAFLRRVRGGDRLGAAGLLSQAGFHLLGLVHYLPYHSGVHLTFCLVWGLCLGPPMAPAGASRRPS